MVRKGWVQIKCQRADPKLSLFYRACLNKAQPPHSLKTLIRRLRGGRRVRYILFLLSALPGSYFQVPRLLLLLISKKKRKINVGVFQLLEGSSLNGVVAERGFTPNELYFKRTDPCASTHTGNTCGYSILPLARYYILLSALRECVPKRVPHRVFLLMFFI